MFRSAALPGTSRIVDLMLSISLGPLTAFFSCIARALLIGRGVAGSALLGGVRVLAAALLLI